MKKIFCVMLLAVLFSSGNMISVLAAPDITVSQGNPDHEVDPPYTIYFEVTDSAGITSITVNNQEIGAAGSNYYDVEWSTYKNGTYTVIATNTAGETTSQNIVLDKIRSKVVGTIPETSAVTTTEAVIESSSAPAAIEPDTQPAQPSSTAATQASKENEPIESEAQPISEPSVDDAEVSTEVLLTADNPEVPPDEIEFTSQMSESDPTTYMEGRNIYRLAPAGNSKNKWLRSILLMICFLVMIYNLFTYLLNIRRLRLYRQYIGILEYKKGEGMNGKEIDSADNIQKER